MDVLVANLDSGQEKEKTNSKEILELANFHFCCYCKKKKKKKALRAHECYFALRMKK